MKVERKALTLSFQNWEGIGMMERIGGFVKVVTDELDPAGQVELAEIGSCLFCKERM